AYFLGERLEKGIWQIAQSDDGMTMAFLTMSMAEIFHSFNMRSQRHSVISMGFKGSHNKFLYLAALVSLVLTTAVIYIPFLSEAFGFTPINLTEYALAMGLALFVIPLVELVKVLQRAFERRRK
ncbi:MAG TPA: cation-translocating P-type ATPase C-terminal domain-containing protein, partial [Oscillospiraceae bacterium]|nr:cation-translocating P-type ATPase C-terminal domain-containing protein [Oscillospiraceae bacterium]